LRRSAFLQPPALSNANRKKCIVFSIIKPFKEIGIADITAVGGKNASLGEKRLQLSSRGINVPDGFATTAFAFHYFLEYNNLDDRLDILLQQLDRKTFFNLRTIGRQARTLMLEAILPAEIEEGVIQAYHDLCGNGECAVSVCSSAIAEDLPQASFAGQHKSYLGVYGSMPLLDAVQKCYASLYSEKAIRYREINGFAHEKVALSVGVQKMV